MIREERFVISHRPYAVHLDTYTANSGTGHCRISAVWFRRRRGVTVACIGELRDYPGRPLPADAAEFLARHDDGRYGGDCHGRWDGDRYWGSQHPDEIDSHLALLKPMLANFPQVPPGYDGWWRF